MSQLPPIPFQDFAGAYRGLRAELRAALDEVGRSGRLILGAQVAAFEREFADTLGLAHAVGVASGTDALHLALKAAGVGPGDEVVTAAFGAPATAAAIVASGARLVLADVDPRSFCLEAQTLLPALTERTRAVVPVHLYGQMADVAAINEVLRGRDVLLVEDAAQAHGARLGPSPVGSLGHVAAFSFYPTKNLWALGDGGLVASSDPSLAERVRLLRQYGQDRTYVMEEVGINSRLDELQAAFLRVHLRRLDGWIARRRALAAIYDRALAGVRTPCQLPGRHHVYHLYVVCTPRRDELQAHLARQGITSLVHYPVPLHLQPALRGLGYRRGDFPVAEACAETVLSLPLHPGLSQAQVRRVASAVRSFF